MTDAALAETLDFSMDANGPISNDVLLPHLARVREAAPVFYSALNHSWWITSHALVGEAFRDRRFSAERISGASFGSIPEAERATRIPVLSRTVDDWIVNVEGEKHRKLRSISSRALNRKFVDSLIPMFERLSHELADKAAAQGTCEFVNGIAYYLPATVIVHLLGLSTDHLDKVRTWNFAVVTALTAMFAEAHLLERADRAIAEMYDMLSVEIAKRRANPQDDLLSHLVNLTDEDGVGRLTESEVLGLCEILLTAGHETTVNSLAFGLEAFVRHPDQMALFLSGEVNPMLAMQEIGRYSAMSTLQSRIATEDFDFHGAAIRKGQMVFLWIAAANHDPAEFPEPGRFDIARSNMAEVMTFGPGIHHCIGHYIARLQMAVFYKAFLPRFSKIEILDDPLVYAPTLAFRGLLHLNARFIPR